MDEVGDIIGELGEPTSEVSRRVEEQVGWADQYITAAAAAHDAQRREISTEKREYRQGKLREKMIAEGALPSPEQPVENVDDEPIA